MGNKPKNLNSKPVIKRRSRRSIKVSDLVMVVEDAKVIVYPDPILSENRFEVEVGSIGIVLETGDEKKGSFTGECRVLFREGTTGWIPFVYIKKISDQQEEKNEKQK